MPPMGKRPDILNQILTEAREQKALKSPLRAIFDLDSTLFDVSPRITKILRDFAAEPATLARFPSEAKVLSIVEPHFNDYGVKRTLERYMTEEPHPDFIQAVVEYWRKHFFGNDYLIYDLPYPGALSYVQELYEVGAEIFYLTGRDIPRMGPGTIESLKQHRFPLNNDNSNLILKPVTGADDAKFKKDFFVEMDQSIGPVWFFENEPANIHLVLEHCPHIKNLFVETVHSEKMPLPGDHVPRVSGFEI
jgi:hypothetical protein